MISDEEKNAQAIRMVAWATTSKELEWAAKIFEEAGYPKSAETARRMAAAWKDREDGRTDTATK